MSSRATATTNTCRRCTDLGGGFIESKGYKPPEKGEPNYPYATMKELQGHAEKNNLTIAQVILANEVAVSGKSEADVLAFVDKIQNAMINIVKAGLAAPTSTLPGPIKLKTKAGDVYKRAVQNKFEREQGIGVVSAHALAGSEENARGHLVVTAPTGGSPGVTPAVVYALGEGGRKAPKDKISQGMLTAVGVGYLCKHNATLAAAEGGCQAEIGVASAMAAAMIAEVMGAPPQVVANAAESSLEHHLGMTCDPVAGFVQIPCIERDAARTKGIKSEVAGDPDILLAPDLEAGNILAKLLNFLAKADSAGLVLGARVPIILTSRADSVRARIASCAVAMLAAHARRATAAVAS